MIIIEVMSVVIFLKVILKLNDQLLSLFMRIRNIQAEYWIGWKEEKHMKILLLLLTKKPLLLEN